MSKLNTIDYIVAMILDSEVVYEHSHTNAINYLEENNINYDPYDLSNCKEYWEQYTKSVVEITEKALKQIKNK